MERERERVARTQVLAEYFAAVIVRPEDEVEHIHRPCSLLNYDDGSAPCIRGLEALGSSQPLRIRSHIVATRKVHVLAVIYTERVQTVQMR